MPRVSLVAAATGKGTSWLRRERSAERRAEVGQVR